MAHGIGFLLFCELRLINGYLKDHKLVFQSHLQLEGWYRCLFVSTARKRGELLIGQARPKECTPARSAHAGAIPSVGELLAPEAAPGGRSPPFLFPMTMEGAAAGRL